MAARDIAVASVASVLGIGAALLLVGRKFVIVVPFGACGCQILHRMITTGLRFWNLSSVGFEAVRPLTRGVATTARTVVMMLRTILIILIITISTPQNRVVGGL